MNFRDAMAEPQGSLDLFGGGGDHPILVGLNPPQREAVEHAGGPLLVLAGAGSGKTRVLTRRVAWLVGQEQVPPRAILAVTFTNKAAGEMRERIAKLVGPHARDAWIGTFHSIGVRFLRMEAERAGLPRDFSIFDREDSLAAIRRVLVEAGLPPKENPPEQFLAAISKAKNGLVSPDQFDEQAGAPWERLAARVYRAYDHSLRSQAALDFDDLLVRPVLLLREPEVRERWARRFRHVLVDEYQDTNRCQYELLRHLTHEHRQLFVVGDDDQSIYRWRGADIANILDFERDFPDAHVVRLEQNYRSTGRILAAANSVIRHNEGRKGKELWTENGEGEPVPLIETPDEQTEAMAVLKLVRDAIEREGRSAGDFAVLYRTNAQSRVMENTFQLARVPYQVIGGQRFYERREIKDVLAFLRLVVNPEDDVAVQRVINVPPRGVGKKSLEDLQADATANGDSLLSAMRRAVSEQGAPLRAAARSAIASFLRVVDRALDAAATRPVEEVTEQILEDVGYEAYLEEDSHKQSYSRWENVTELLASMGEFTDEPGREEASVAAFLQEVSLLTDADDVDEDVPRVTLMTLHNAKGLEFPVVFISGAEEGLFPNARSADEPGGLEEERRLFYVGLTRARERVSVLWASSRRKWDGVSYTVPSRFLDEIDPEHVVRQTVGARPSSGGGYSRYGGGSSGSQRPYGRGAGGARHVSVETWESRRAERRPAAEDVPDYTPSYEDDSQEIAALKPGMRVMHPSWGEGILEDIEGSGERTKLTIRFRGGILKKVLAMYAKLDLLG
ncbi:MAG: UvrD-helicase domain-containing protein [Gemmatimonadetes bacterium]|nr:UvrD-helicase domain-containing protein [Gemmatimonadota bacterium]